MYLIIAALGIFVLTATFLVEGGGKSTATVNFITVFDLTNNASQYDDREIETRGTLEYEDAFDTYFVSDGGERLRVVSVEDDIAGLVGAEVRVVGRLMYDADGVYIEADRVHRTEV